MSEAVFKIGNAPLMTTTAAAPGTMLYIPARRFQETDEQWIRRFVRVEHIRSAA
jgi:hypothetical protein